MDAQHDINVAVLLATYNGARFIEPQIRSLNENSTRFTLHWLDDGSSDGTRDAVCAAAQSAGVVLREWHHPEHLSIPKAYFHLLERVEADIYLFCDQDDIWQRGKIDAYFTSLRPDLASPALCFSDFLMFNEDEPRNLRRFSDVMADGKAPRALQESRLFMAPPPFGHVQGFTRPLRDIFLKHKEIAHAYALMHDHWMYLIAVASGSPRLLSNVPTTLYRLHGNNFGNFALGAMNARPASIIRHWRLQQMRRPGLAHAAKGFVLAADTLPPGPKRDQSLAIARLVAEIDRRQSLAAVIRLVRRGALWPSRRSAFFFAAACLCSEAKPFDWSRLSATRTKRHSASWSWLN